MKFPTFKRIYKTDYPQEQQSLVEKLSVTINSGFEVVYNAMSHNVSLSDNIFCTVRTIPVTVDATGTPNTTISFKLDTVGIIKGISVIRANNTTDPKVFVTSTPFITYSQNDTLITISNIKGLPANNNFEITLIAWA